MTIGPKKQVDYLIIMWPPASALVLPKLFYFSFYFLHFYGPASALPLVALTRDLNVIPFFNIDIPDLLVVSYITAYNSIDGLLALPFIDYFEIRWRNWGLELILPPYIISPPRPYPTPNSLSGNRPI